MFTWHSRFSTRSLLVILVALGTVFASGQIALSATTSYPADKMTVTGSNVEVIAPGTNVTLLEAHMRASTTEDLVLQVTAECSIVTSTTTTNDTATAYGQVRIWIEVDGAPVPVSGTDDGKVVFCNRAQTQTISGNDTLTLYLSTRQSNAFNWVRLNVGNGIHDIAVKAELTATTMNTATAEAMVGNRTLVVQPTKSASNESLQ